MKRLISRTLTTTWVTALAVLSPGAHAETLHEWAPRALRLQANLDIAAPLTKTTWVGTHNSFANPKDDNLLDYNQPYSLKEQLRAGVRELVFDVHYENDDILLCHNNTKHRLCMDGVTGNRKLVRALEDLKEWIREGNTEQVVLLKLSLADSARRNINKVETKLDNHLGPYIYQTKFAGQSYGNLNPSTGCTSLYRLMTKQDVLNKGKNVLIFTSEGCISDGGFNTLVFYENGEIQQPKKPSDISPDSRDAILSRVKDGATRDGQLGSGEDITLKAGAISNWLDAGLNIFEMYGFNAIASYPAAQESGVSPSSIETKWLLESGAQPPRGEHLVWSWMPARPNDKAGNKNCAIVSKEARYVDEPRFSDMSCEGSYRFACQNNNSGAWSVSSGKGAWSDSAGKCPAGSSFRVPINKPELNQLWSAVAETGEPAWVNYTDQVSEGHWVANRSPAALDKLRWEESAPVMGGTGGSAFDDVEQLIRDLYRSSKRDVSKIEIASGNRVDKVRLTYSDGTEVSHGSDDPKSTLILDRGEYIASAEVCSGKHNGTNRIFYLKFTTSTKRTIQGGKSKGATCKTFSSSGKELFALKGRAGTELDALSFYFRAR